MACAVAASLVMSVTSTELAWSFGAVLHAGAETIDRGGGTILMVAESVASVFLECVETGASRGDAAIVGAPTTTSVLLAGVEPVLCRCGTPLMSTPSTPSMLLAGVEADADRSGTVRTRAAVTTSVLRAGDETGECSRWAGLVRAPGDTTMRATAVRGPYHALTTVDVCAHPPLHVREAEPPSPRWLLTALMRTQLHRGFDDGCHGLPLW